MIPDRGPVNLLARIWRLTGRRDRVTKPWLPVDASRRGNSHQRTPSIYEGIIEQFDVEKNARYRKGQQGLEETYCNIFVWDVTRAMAPRSLTGWTVKAIPALRSTAPKQRRMQSSSGYAPMAPDSAGIMSIWWPLKKAPTPASQ